MLSIEALGEHQQRRSPADPAVDTHVHPRALEPFRGFTQNMCAKSMY